MTLVVPCETDTAHAACTLVPLRWRRRASQAENFAHEAVAELPGSALSISSHECRVLAAVTPSSRIFQFAARCLSAWNDPIGRSNCFSRAHVGDGSFREYALRPADSHHRRVQQAAWSQPRLATAARPVAANGHGVTCTPLTRTSARVRVRVDKPGGPSMADAIAHLSSMSAKRYHTSPHFGRAVEFLPRCQQ